MMTYCKHQEVALLLTRGLDTLGAVTLSLQTAPGPITVAQVLSDACGVMGAADSWQVWAAVDVLKDQGLIRFVDRVGPFSQHERYVWHEERKIKEDQS